MLMDNTITMQVTKDSEQITVHLKGLDLVLVTICPEEIQVSTGPP